MHLLVTGGCGFIGSQFIRQWRAEHPTDRITNLDALTYAGNPANLADIPENDPHYRFLHGTITDPAMIANAFDGVETVVHFAAESHVDRSIQNAHAFLETNIIGTWTLLEEARKRRGQITRFHHVSTDEVFGSLSTPEAPRFSETTPYQPRSPYSAAKASSDHFCLAAYETHRVPVTISNCSNNCGPYMFPEKFIPLAITNLLRGKPIPVYGSGANIRDWLHVEDHCRAIEAILLRGREGERYVIGGDAEWTNLAVARKILELFELDEKDYLRFVADRPGHDLRYAIDHRKITEELGWNPRISFADGLAQTIEWYKTHPSWWTPLLQKTSL
jgi:dTDP-glucose 4,6-dehydratase